MSNADPALFSDLGLPEPILRAVVELGYEAATPIQAQCIPLLLKGGDLLGQAQTGTGKTAAFALPLLSRIDDRLREPQLLILAPTRELAIQVAEACQSYSRHLRDVHVLPVYGGQSYTLQTRPLKRGVQVVVGTPGRIMDHMRRGTLKLDALQALVLDEADEMLRMGFIDDVEWILEHTPESCQMALFSATMPNVIRKVADKHLKDATSIHIEATARTADGIRQRYWSVSGMNKLDALTRLLETESTDGVIIFVRTRNATEELAERLNARGLEAAALHGDIQQAQREKIVDKLRKEQIDILVATDVVARGLDVPRISHVINYDIPSDPESYVHRIGRTGRAGRAGEAILFVSPREHRMLRTIERATRSSIESMQMPQVRDVNEQRTARFKQRIVDAMQSEPDPVFYRLVNEIEQQHDVDPLELAAVLAQLLQGDAPLLLTENKGRRRERGANEASPFATRNADGGRDQERAPRRPRTEREDRGERPARAERQSRGERSAPSYPRERDFDGERESFEPRENRRPRQQTPSARANRLRGHPDVEMVRYKLAVGNEHGVKPGQIVGAIANEAGIESEFIGTIDIYEDFSTIDLPEGMPRALLNELKKTRVCNRPIEIQRMQDESQDRGPKSRAPGTPPRKAKAKSKKHQKRVGKPKARARNKNSG